jgi:hypothetical protein
MVKVGGEKRRQGTTKNAFFPQIKVIKGYLRRFFICVICLNLLKSAGERFERKFNNREAF